ncbi:helix-turn-helix domain-containing protein [Bacillus cereus group sp. Bc256]|uniref:helix-turn-helix domain-containing protein n=1 Tax=unclassified Bacillus cereus group TaxID=2750818 RepID=UPI001F5AFA49|nr:MULTISPECIES: helix-turn-helix domain-containing protein [unclassified Bacillus cereus group]MDA2141277.1 helix-turn-helix domain-containing protein [Bacillus cereus group sp. Bc256]MDA2599120.1 helix-turn-helix domain-containing protein [Bacillus cereus group sp. Bc061]
MLIKRQYHILKHLVQEFRWFSINELAIKINCSTKTIQRDLLYLQKNLPNKWSIKICKNKGVKLYKPFNACNREIEFLYWKHTLFFKTLNILLDTKLSSNAVLAEKLYIQNKKVQNILKDVTSHLQQYNIRLKRSPLRLSGNNVDILLMYYDLYIIAYSDQEWPFKQIKRELLIEYLTTVEKTKNIIFYKDSIKELSFFICLYLKRKNNGYSISLKHWQIKQIQKSFKYKKLQEITKCIFKKYNIQLTNLDIAIFIMAINCSAYTYKKANNPEPIRSIKVPSCPILKDFIYKLEEKFRMNLLCDFEFINLLNQILLPKKQSFLQFNNRSNYVTNSHIRKKHSAIFFLIDKKLRNLQKIYKKNNSSLRTNISVSHVALLTMHIVTRQMKLQQKTPQIILYTKKGEYWKRYLAEFINSTFKQKINFIDVHYEDLISYNTEYSGVSCIITDTPIKVNYIPVIFISTVPTKRNLEEIKKFL